MTTSDGAARMEENLTIVGPDPGPAPACERILRSVPEWFGIESALQQYVNDVQRLPTFLASADGEIVGFLSVREHFPESAEIHVMAVARDRHRQGLGRALLDAAETWLGARGCLYLQVKTVSPSRADESYARTRAFYGAMGFSPLEEFPTLWSEANPCLLMVKTLAAR